MWILIIQVLTVTDTMNTVPTQSDSQLTCEINVTPPVMKGWNPTMTVSGLGPG